MLRDGGLEWGVRVMMPRGLAGGLDNQAPQNPSPHHIIPEHQTATSAISPPMGMVKDTGEKGRCPQTCQALVPGGRQTGSGKPMGAPAAWITDAIQYTRLGSTASLLRTSTFMPFTTSSHWS